MRALLDSNILIDALRGIAAAESVIMDVPQAFISRVTWIEIMAGAGTGAARLATRDYLSGVPLLELDDEVAAAAADIRRQHKLKLPDAIIYATARVHKLVLLTRNTKDFPPGMPGVKVPYTL